MKTIHKKYLIQQFFIALAVLGLYNLFLHNFSGLITQIGLETLGFGLGMFGIHFLSVKFAKQSKIAAINYTKEESSFELYHFILGRFYLAFFLYVFFNMRLGAEIGVFKFYHEISEYGWWYYLLSFPLIVVLHDLHFYVTHMMMHKWNWFYKFHRPHHEVTNISSMSVSTFHPIETFVLFSFYPTVALFMPVHHSVLFFSLYITAFIDWNIHSGFVYIPWLNKQRWYRKFFNTTLHHQHHHVIGRGNYGLYFNYLDRIFKTDKFKDVDPYEKEEEK